jgi:hypothetical protein
VFQPRKFGYRYLAKDTGAAVVDCAGHKEGFMNSAKTAVTTLVATLLLALSAFAGSASSAQNVQDGLVNVAVYDITVIDGDVIVTLNRVISDVNVGVAAQIAANVCGVKVGPLAILGQAVDRSGATRTACETGSQIVEFEQN